MMAGAAVEALAKIVREPWASKISRKRAGTEIRPLASTRLTNVERKGRDTFMAAPKTAQSKACRSPPRPKSPPPNPALPEVKMGA
jgi:hypothetical protein